MTQNKDGLATREKVWLEAWIAIAASTNCMNHSVATNWADICLEEFDKRFLTKG